jgi:hypothetical protein
VSKTSVLTEPIRFNWNVAAKSSDSFMRPDKTFHKTDGFLPSNKDPIWDKVNLESNGVPLLISKSNPFVRTDMGVLVNSENSVLVFRLVTNN